MAQQSSNRVSTWTPDRSARSATPDSSGWRRFSDSTPAQRGGAINRSAGSAMSNPATYNNVQRPGNSSRPEASSNDGGWRHFTPQSGGVPADRVSHGVNTGVSPGGGMYSGRGAEPDFQRGPYREVGGGRSVSAESPRGYSRPPLEMRQPIVTPRGYGGGGGSAPRESAPSRGGGGGGGGGSHGGGGGPHGGSGRH